MERCRCLWPEQSFSLALTWVLRAWCAVICSGGLGRLAFALPAQGPWKPLLQEPLKVAVGGSRFVLLPFQRWCKVLELLQAEGPGGGVVWGICFPCL